jgi:hypothetical protein
MKKKTVIGLVLAVGLLLIGTIAYGHWNDYGSQGNYVPAYGYGSGYGYQSDSNTNVKDSAARNYVPYSGYRDHTDKWNDSSQGRKNSWTGYRGYGNMSSMRCWW